VCSRLYYLGLCKYTVTFAQWRNRLTMHFSERFSVVKRRVTVLSRILCYWRIISTNCSSTRDPSVRSSETSRSTTQIYSVTHRMNRNVWNTAVKPPNDGWLMLCGKTQYSSTECLANYVWYKSFMWSRRRRGSLSELSWRIWWGQSSMSVSEHNLYAPSSPFVGVWLG